MIKVLSTKRLIHLYTFNNIDGDTWVTINIIAEREADATAKKHQELLKKKIQKNCGIRIVYIAKVHS